MLAWLTCVVSSVIVSNDIDVFRLEHAGNIFAEMETDDLSQVCDVISGRSEPGTLDDILGSIFVVRQSPVAEAEVFRRNDMTVEVEKVSVNAAFRQSSGDPEIERMPYEVGSFHG